MSSQNKESVYLLPDEVLTSDDSKILRLKDPNSNLPSYFLLSQSRKKLYEIQGFDEKHRSWLIKENVHSDGCMKIVTPYNPVFLILPYLIKATKNVPLDHLLEDEHFPAMPLLADLVDDLSCVADRKGSPSLNVWSYNEQSTLDWLSDKIDKLTEKLFKTKEKPSATASIAYDKASYRALSFGILSENLSENLSSKLKVHIKLPEKEKVIEGSKKPKLEQKSPDSGTRNTAAANKKPAVVVKQSAKSKALAKSAKGSKSITSFFTKK